MEARNEMLRRKVTSVPTFIIGEDIIIGLDKERILYLVDHRVVECASCHQKVRVPINNTKIIAKCPNCKSIISV